MEKHGLTGIILAGGEGSRMGGAKPATRLAGTTLLERAGALLAPYCGSIVVAGGDWPLAGARLVPDPPGPAGPLRGLVAGLGAAEGEAVLVLACDLPLAGPALAALAAHPGAGAVIAADADGPNPLCARYPRAAALRAAGQILASGRRQARLLPEALGAAEVRVPAPALLNLNRPGDLERAARLLGA